MLEEVVKVDRLMGAVKIADTEMENAGCHVSAFIVWQCGFGLCERGSRQSHGVPPNL